MSLSQTVMERLSSSIATSLSEMVRESFRSALFESVVPVMEKAHAQIFRQINQAFQTGTKECKYRVYHYYIACSISLLTGSKII